MIIQVIIYDGNNKNSDYRDIVLEADKKYEEFSGRGFIERLVSFTSNPNSSDLQVRMVIYEYAIQIFNIIKRDYL